MVWWGGGGGGGGPSTMVFSQNNSMFIKFKVDILKGNIEGLEKL